MRLTIFLAILTVLLLPLPAYAYLGPGLGLGAVGAILGILFSIFLAIVGIFWYPIKRLIGKMRKPSKENGPE
jgi:hypothetical protein